jgi:hypothetical protein
VIASAVADLESGAAGGIEVDIVFGPVKRRVLIITLS